MTYPGGKNGSGVYQQIINQIPPHRVYIEPFLGSGAILRYKHPAQQNIGIDLDDNALCGARHGAHTQLIQADATIWLKNFPFIGDEFIYADPPYLLSTRKEQSPLYQFEMTTEQEHRQLLHLLKSLKACIAISGYWSGLYATELATWRTIHFQTITRGGSLATEWLWMNYPEPVELHDYRFLGNNYRERERIRRKQTRWKNRLQNMPTLERYALLSVITDLTTPETTIPSAASLYPAIGAPTATPDDTGLHPQE